MVVEPVATPVTVPVVPTEAVPGAALVHVPPVVVSVSDCVAAGQIEKLDGLMGKGAGLTVTTAVAAQPVAGSV